MRSPSAPASSQLFEIVARRPHAAADAPPGPVHPEFSRAVQRRPAGVPDAEACEAGVEAQLTHRLTLPWGMIAMALGGLDPAQPPQAPLMVEIAAAHPRLTRAHARLCRHKPVDETAGLILRALERILAAMREARQTGATHLAIVRARG